MADLMKVEAVPLAVKEQPGKDYRFVKFRGQGDAIAWGPVELGEAAGQECIVELRPADQEGRSPALVSLTRKETGEVIYREPERKKKGGGGGWGGSRASDPAERASIEAQSAVSHTLQEIRMAGDLLLRLVAAVAPYNSDGIATAAEALVWIKQELGPLAEQIRDWRSENAGHLAAQLAAMRLATMARSGASGSPSGPGGSAAPAGPRGRRQAPPGKSPSDSLPTQPGSGPSGDPDAPLTKATLQAKALERFEGVAGVKDAALALFDKAMSPGQMSVEQLERLLEEAAP